MAERERVFRCQSISGSLEELRVVGCSFIIFIVVDGDRFYSKVDTYLDFQTLNKQRDNKENEHRVNESPEFSKKIFLFWCWTDSFFSSKRGGGKLATILWVVIPRRNIERYLTAIVPYIFHPTTPRTHFLGYGQTMGDPRNEYPLIEELGNRCMKFKFVSTTICNSYYLLSPRILNIKFDTV